MSRCARKTCSDTAPDGFQFCSALCKSVHIEVNKTLAKGDGASMAELSALLGVVEAVNLWRVAVMAEHRAARTSTST